MPWVKVFPSLLVMGRASAWLLRLVTAQMSESPKQFQPESMILAAILLQAKFLVSGKAYFEALA